MKPADIVLLLIDEVDFDEPPISISDLVVKLLTQSQRVSTISDAQILAETHASAIQSRLKAVWNGHSDRGRPLKLVLFQTASGDTLIRGICHIFSNDTPDEIAAKKRRKLSFVVESTLNAMVDPYDFERLCSKILGLLGVETPVVTKAARDEGVDFFGKLNPVAEKYLFDVSPTVQKKLDIWLIGQAKHYPQGKAGTPDLRHLFGAVSLARANAYSTNSYTAKTLTLKIADPVFYLFFTTGELSKDAWNLVDKTGIVAMDGRMLSAFLADRGQADTIADPTKFQQWLTS
ncbi:MAG: restriction endonuclease [Polaromonas sp.]|uniref:restriction endonuclease n=1 Tax=Polaromonas sp. TaxID=1869339 RepID=UPI00248963B8|nr:restriction endonuclease [Polaromonas sp.]MDI1238861.1 restriction endonuclease [Polaromonas sp.]